MDALHDVVGVDTLEVGLCHAASHRLGGGVELTEAVEFHADALCDEFGDTLRHLDEHALDDVTGVDAAVVLDVLGESSQRQCLASVHLRVVFAVTGGVHVGVLTVIDLQCNFVCCHTFVCFKW